MVHSTQGGVNDLEKMLGERYSFKKLANLGFEDGDSQSAIFLNRVISLETPRHNQRKAVMEPDSTC